MNDTSLLREVGGGDAGAASRSIPEAVTNTQLVADQCNLELEFGRLHLPEPEIPTGYTPHEYLTHLAREGLNRQLSVRGRRRCRRACSTSWTSSRRRGSRTTSSSSTTSREFCKRAGIMLGVRGSAAASIILYALDVTFIDPLATRLVFERFLHVDRKEPPDVDFDIPDDRRDEVIKLRRREVRLRSRRADHHLRHDGREGRDPRHRPRARHVVRRCRPRRARSCRTRCT